MDPVLMETAPIDTLPTDTVPMDDEAEARFSSVVETIAVRETERQSGREMWHAHHWPEEYDRCVVVGRRHVCRRCLTLYPIAIAVAVLTLAGGALWPESLDLWFIWLLCIPATVDFVAEQLQRISYSARRQVLTTAMLAPALGRGMGYELADSWSWEFWGPVLVFCTIWFFAALDGRRRRNT